MDSCDPYKGHNCPRCAGRRASARAEPETAAPVARAERPGGAADEAATRLGVREPVRFALAAEAADDDRLGAAVLLDPVLAVAVADPGLLPAAHWNAHRRHVDNYVVDVHGTCLDPPSDLLSTTLLAEDRSGEPVARVVSELERLLGVAHLHHPDNRAEGLIAHHLH